MRETIGLQHIAPSSIQIQSNVLSSIPVLKTSIKNKNSVFGTKKEAIYHLTHYVNNTMHNNGRIYMKIDSNGVLYANSVSPYSENFKNNIEPLIYPVVNALCKKRYLTYSSCQGHGLTFRRYVGIAFPDQESREYVIKAIQNLGLYGVELRKKTSVINQKLTFDDETPQYINKFKSCALKEKERKEHKDNEVETFNVQFHREYEEYYFLEIVIFSEIDPSYKKIFQNPIKNLILCFMKLFFWNKTTLKISRYIESTEFKHFLY